MRFGKILLLGLVLLATPVWSGPIASVTKVEGASVTLNRGKDQSLAPGAHLFISRGGKNLAEVEVSQVDESSSQARIVRVFGGDSILTGDLVTTESIAGGEATPGPSAGLPGVLNPASVPPARMQFKPLPLDLTLEQAEQAYRETFQVRTQKKDFRQVVSSAQGRGESMPGMDAMNIYMTADMLATSFGPGGFYGDPTMLLMSAWGAMEGKKQREKLFDSMDVKVRAEVTLWDQELLETYGQYAALVNGFSEPGKYQDFMRNLAAQKGVGSGRVFEVRLRNTGQLKAQLSPFNWHIFMIGPNQSRVGAIKYDNPLDRLIEPGREVSGNVYFPTVPSPSSTVQVVLEDMYGDRGELEFSLER